MISAYECNLFGKEYEPYIAWKKGEPLFSKEQCHAMWQKVREQLDTLYEHTHSPKINCLHTLKQWKVSYLASQSTEKHMN